MTESTVTTKPSIENGVEISAYLSPGRVLERKVVPAAEASKHFAIFRENYKAVENIIIRAVPVGNTLPDATVTNINAHRERRVAASKATHPSLKERNARAAAQVRYTSEGAPARTPAKRKKNKKPRVIPVYFEVVR